MKRKLQDKLFKKFPKIFRQKDLSPQETCMCWGITTGDGWYWLIYRLCENIQNYIDGNKHLKIPQVEATQVKEKFGILRFYICGGDTRIQGMVQLAENTSSYICEDCGSIIKVKRQTDNGWITTLCQECRRRKETK